MSAIVCESIDISNNNGASFPLANILAGHPNIQVVGLKATEGFSFRDPDFASFYATCETHLRVALPYCFARPETGGGVAGGVKEADALLADYGAVRMRGKAAGVPVCDYETIRDVAFARGFLGRVAAKCQRRPLVYCSLSRVAELAADPWIATHADFWIADYGVTKLPPLKVRVVMWQYTDHGAFSTDASHVFVRPDDLRLHPRPVPYLEVVKSGRVVMRIRYGGGRVKKYLHGSRVLRALASGAHLRMRRH